MDEFSFFNLHAEDVEELAANRLDDIGGPHSHSNYPWGWAQAGNSPLRWYKQNTYGGGVRDPLVVHWPAGIADAGALRTQFCHAVDVAATVLDVTGTPLPEQFGGHPQIPLHGRSIRPTFDDPAAPPPRSVQYFEQMGHRGIWAEGWKATTYHVAGHPYDLDEWELFHLDEDFSECANLAATEPERLRELVDRWWAEAGEMGVLPLDDRTIELFGGEARPGTPHARTTYEYLHPISHIPADASALLGGRSWTVTAEVVVGEEPASGVLYARGSHNVGHTFFLAGGRLEFDYNALGDHRRAGAALELAPGPHRLSARFERDGAGGVLTLAADGRDLDRVEVPRLVRMLGSTGTDVGRDALSSVVDDYEGPNPFNGTIERLVIEIRSRRSPADVAATAHMEMARE
jgi:arylsulfatase